MEKGYTNIFTLKNACKISDLPLLKIQMTSIRKFFVYPACLFAYISNSQQDQFIFLIKFLVKFLPPVYVKKNLKNLYFLPYFIKKFYISLYKKFS